MDEYLDYAEDCINTNNFNRTIYDDHFMPILLLGRYYKY